MSEYEDPIEQVEEICYNAGAEEVYTTKWGEVVCLVDEPKTLRALKKMSDDIDKLRYSLRKNGVKTVSVSSKLKLKNRRRSGELEAHITIPTTRAMKKVKFSESFSIRPKDDEQYNDILNDSLYIEKKYSIYCDLGTDFDSLDYDCYDEKLKFYRFDDIDKLEGSIEDFLNRTKAFKREIKKL